MNNNHANLIRSLSRDPFLDLVDQIREKQQACKKALRETMYDTSPQAREQHAVNYKELQELTQQLVRIHKLAPAPELKPKLIIA